MVILPFTAFTGSDNSSGSGTGDRTWYPGTIPVPVPDFTGGSGSGTGTGAKFSSGRVLTQY